MTYQFDNFSKDFVTILSAQQTLENKDWYQGTADAVRQNLPFFENLGDMALVLSGDHLYRMDYRKFVSFHLDKKAEISISVIPVRTDQVGDLGVMNVDKTGRVVEFQEKPKDPGLIDRMRIPEEVFQEFGVPPAGRTHLASMGIYIFNWDALKELLEHSAHEDFGREVIPLAISRKKVFGYLFNDYWEDIGTIPSFFEANLDLTEPLPRFNFYDEEKPIFTHARFLPGSKILSFKVDRSILCEGSIINKSRIEHSIVGVRSRVGEHCLLERTVVMGADYFESNEELARNAGLGNPAMGIGSGCEIRNAIIDKNARIGRGVKLINARGVGDEQAENYAIVNGIIVVPKNGIIPDGTVV